MKNYVTTIKRMRRNAVPMTEEVSSHAHAARTLGARAWRKKTCACANADLARAEYAIIWFVIRNCKKIRKTRRTRDEGNERNVMRLARCSGLLCCARPGREIKLIRIHARSALACAAQYIRAHTPLQRVTEMRCTRVYSFTAHTSTAIHNAHAYGRLTRNLLKKHARDLARRLAQLAGQGHTTCAAALPSGNHRSILQTRQREKEGGWEEGVTAELLYTWENQLCISV